MMRTHHDQTALGVKEKVIKTWLLFVLVSLMRMIIDVTSFPTVRIIDNRTVSLVIFQNTFCQVKSKNQLREQMGLAFDPDRMAMTEEEMAALNRISTNITDSDDAQAISEENTDRVKRDTDSDAIISVFSKLSDQTTGDRNENTELESLKGPTIRNSIKFKKKMRGHSRLRTYKHENKNREFNRTDHRVRSEKRTELSRRNGRSIPAAFRKLPWKCEMETSWVRMQEGVFPPYLQTGRCVTKTCMYGFFECTPKKYVIKVLKRDTSRCNPIPVIATNTTYEEVWTFSRYHVTVCCECSRINHTKKHYGQRKKQRKGRRRKTKLKVRHAPAP